MPTPLISGADAPVAAGAPLFVTIPVVVEAVLPAASAPPPAGLDFLAFPRLCSDALIRRLATQRPARGRRVFDPGGVTPVSPRAFRHIALFVRPWLSARERVSVGACGREWRCWELFGDSPLSPPRPVMPYRFRGFGVRSPLICARHTAAAAWGPFHHVWDFLTWSERAALTTAYRALEPYALLRRTALSFSVAPLREPRPPPCGAPIDLHRSRLMACALLRFDFLHGDLIRWLGGEYTNEFRDWEAVFDAVDVVRDCPPLPGYPLVDVDRAYRLATQGAPLAGIFECAFSETAFRNLYNNHPPLAAVCDVVLQKFTEEEELSYHIALPRWLWRFMPGLHLSPLSWITRKGKGRLICDSSSLVGDETALHSGAPNLSIPAPSVSCLDENPPVEYGSAFMRHLVRLWNLRITYPGEEILQYGDDIAAAFRRVLYHPDAAVVFAQVFLQFLFIPVGGIFGSRSGPSWWCIFSELRSHFASILTLAPAPAPPLPLTCMVSLTSEPSLRERAHFALAVVDARHRGIDLSRPELTPYSCFVDDNQMAALRTYIMRAIDCSVASAYLLFGAPDVDRRPCCLNEAKFRPVATYLMDFLGFTICTRTLEVRWPVSKRLALLDTLVAHWSGDPCRVSPRQIASVLGVVRNACFISPFGAYLSIRLQQALNAAVSLATATRSGASAQWWGRVGVLIGPEPLADLALLRSTLTSDERHPAWCRPIGLLIPRSPTLTILSDAAYGGIGGWCASPPFMWRLSDRDLARSGFPVKELREGCSEPVGSADGLHINVLEFLALIINAWLALSLLRLRPALIGGEILAVLADNTSALSWMKHASRSHRPPVRRLARCLSALFLASPVQAAVSGSHIPGKDNVAADRLSRVNEYPTWPCVIAGLSHLQHLPAYRLPHRLLSLLSSTVSEASLAEEFVPAMTRLLTVAPVILPIGSPLMATRTSYSPRSRRNRR